MKRRNAARVILEPLETRTLLSSVPTGTVQVLNASTISGWVFNADDGANALDVSITIDGQPTLVTADQERTDLTAKLGSPNHGFSFSVPDLATGAHTVTVDLVDPFTNFTKRLRTATINIAPPKGAVNVFNRMTVSGWAYSAANGGAPVDVILTVNGTQYAMTADQDRADLLTKVGSTDHAFSFTMPALKLGNNSVALAAVDPSTGTLKVLKSGTINVGVPVGAVNVFNSTTLSGWVFSPLEGAAPVNVVITVNGNATTVVANTQRSDVQKNYGTAYHGFTFSMPMLAPGTNTVTVDLVDPFTGQTRRIKSGTLMNVPPTAKVDVHTATEIAGSVSDSNTTASVQIQIMVDGSPMGDPFTANDPRKMKGTTAIGFDVSGDFAGKVVEIFAIDQPSGQSILVWTNNHAPKGGITTATAYTITGWAVDPDSPGTPVTVRVDIDGVTLTTATANIARNDLQKTAGALDVGYSVDIPGLTPGKHTIKVYALDDQASAQPPVLLATRTVTNGAPVGKVETMNASVVSGWALDPDLGADPATVNVYVDDQFFGSTTANLSRPDLIAKYHSPNHGFSMDLSSVAPGAHSITVTVLDNRTSAQNEVVIYDGVINNHLPTGGVEQITGTTITGWAYDQDTDTSPIDVDIYVDGVFSETVTADQPDTNAPTDNHGFVTDLPTLTWGTHQIDFYAKESVGNTTVLIGSQKVTNNRPIGLIESATSSTITGWAADPDRLGESVQVQLYVNGVLADTETADGARADLLTLDPLSSVPSFSNYGYTLTLPTLASGDNQIDVYAVDLNNGQISSLGSVVLTV